MSDRMIGKIDSELSPEIAFITVQGKKKEHTYMAVFEDEPCKDREGNIVQPQAGDEVEFEPFGAGWAGEVVLLRTSQQIKDEEQSIYEEFADRIPGLNSLGEKIIPIDPSTR